MPNVQRLNEQLARFNRRRALGAAAALVGGAALKPAFSQTVPRVTFGVVAKDGSAIPPTLLQQDQALQKEFGIAVEARPYPSVTAVWTAFAAGEFEFLVGGPANFAALVLRGAPIHIMSTYAVSNVDIFGNKRIETADDLRGKRLTAVIAGLWKLTEAQIKSKFGLAPGSGYQLIPVPNLMSGVAQVLAGTADFAMGWEPDTTRVRLTHPHLKIALSTTDLRPKDEQTFIQVIGSKNSVTPENQRKAIAALSAMTERVMKDPVAAEAQFAALTGAEKGPFPESVMSKRYQLVVRALTPADRAMLNSDMLQTVPPGTVLPESLLTRK